MLDLSQFQNILDLACGPGGWVQDVAHFYPKARVVGIDITSSVVQYARAMARVQWLDNACFQVMDIHQPLDFPENSFDLVNARLLEGCMPKGAWLPLLQECWRILQPGGVIQLLESNFPRTNSQAIKTVSDIYARALYNANYSFSFDGQPVALTTMLAPLLDESGYQRIQSTAHHINFSSETEIHISFFRDFLILIEQLKPFFLKMEATTLEEIERLQEQMQFDMYSNTFYGVWPFVRVIGRKSMTGVK
ncbi:MAG: hypothetical protein NVS2B2_37630 [Ktedonobacteraceae bacterium]